MPAPLLSESDIPRTERLPGPPCPYVPGDSDAAAADPLGLAAAARAYHEFRRSAGGDVDGWTPAFSGDPRHAELFRVLHRRNPDAALELADRQVVLKVSVDVRAEAEALARLLHTNIVPVYSVHRAGPLQAVCMPYCGG